MNGRGRHQWPVEESRSLSSASMAA